MGDAVLIPAVVVELSSSGDDYCNVTVETQIGRRPDGQKERICAINTGVLLRIGPETAETAPVAHPNDGGPGGGSPGGPH